jgi:uncharacterized protein
LPSPTELLRKSSVSVSPETFAIVSLMKERWFALLAESALSPRMSAPFMIFMDLNEVTLVLDETDLRTMLPGLADARIERGYRLLTFDVVMDLSVTGFIAEVSRILAEAAIPILPLSSFSRDHLLVRQAELGAALKALGPHVAELC